MPFLERFQSAIHSFKSLFKQQFAVPVDAQNEITVPETFTPDRTGMRGVWIPSTDCKVLTSKQR
ncbi:hypothetical protein QT970_07485, partial [Microcoleus sp. herbarium8]